MATQDILLRDELERAYKSGDDRSWTSDFQGKSDLLVAVLGEEKFRRLQEAVPRALGPHPDPEDIALFDEKLKEWLRPLPHEIRMVVELRHGVWSGSVLPCDFETIAEATGLPAEDSNVLYEAGLILLRLERYRLPGRVTQ